ncbi:hypothetical protein BJ912DRAFT_1138365 [Pholiota molesta]|nr:hypothetical protein BJ912DRAFT_1138365 [Pholiota molesta]
MPSVRRRRRRLWVLAATINHHSSFRPVSCLSPYTLRSAVGADDESTRASREAPWKHQRDDRISSPPTTLNLNGVRALQALGPTARDTIRKAIAADDEDDHDEPGWIMSHRGWYEDVAGSTLRWAAYKGTNGLLLRTTTHNDDLISHDLSPRADMAALHKPRPRRQSSTSIARASNGDPADAHSPILVVLHLYSWRSRQRRQRHGFLGDAPDERCADYHGGWLGATNCVVAAKDGGDWVSVGGCARDRRLEARTNEEAGERTDNAIASQGLTRGERHVLAGAVLLSPRLLCSDCACPISAFCRKADNGGSQYLRGGCKSTQCIANPTRRRSAF